MGARVTAGPSSKVDAGDGEAVRSQTPATGRAYTLGELVRSDFDRHIQELVIESERRKAIKPDNKSIDWTGPLPMRRKLRVLLQRTFLAVLFYRLSHAAAKRGIPLLPRIFVQWNVSRHGLEIDPAAEIGPGLEIGHTVANVIGPIRAGKNLSLMGGVTIGGRGTIDPLEDGNPVIGDNVRFLAGSAAWGPIEIGSGTWVGARAVLTQSVPPGSFVIAPKSTVVVDPPPHMTGRPRRERS
jgi:serine O-acetyltransferase